MSWPLDLEGVGGLAIGLLAGVAFGFILERGGLGDPKKLTGLFYLEDFTDAQGHVSPRSPWLPRASAALSLLGVAGPLANRRPARPISGRRPWAA